MYSTVKANVTKMFSEFEPSLVSGSVSELGHSAGSLTWRNALRIAEAHADWLLSDLDAACDAMRGWCKSTGAWSEEDMKARSEEDFLALFVQNVAAELRNVLCADEDFEGVVSVYDALSESDLDTATCVIGGYSRDTNGDTLVDYYPGC